MKQIVPSAVPPTLLPRYLPCPLYGLFLTHVQTGFAAMRRLALIRHNTRIASKLRSRRDGGVKRSATWTGDKAPHQPEPLCMSLDLCLPFGCIPLALMAHLPFSSMRGACGTAAWRPVCRLDLDQLKYACIGSSASMCSCTLPKLLSVHAALRTFSWAQPCSSASRGPSCLTERCMDVQVCLAGHAVRMCSLTELCPACTRDDLYLLRAPRALLTIVAVA